MVARGTAWCSMRQGGRLARPTGSPGASQMCRQQARPQVQAVGSPSPRGSRPCEAPGLLPAPLPARPGVGEPPASRAPAPELLRLQGRAGT